MGFFGWLGHKASQISHSIGNKINSVAHSGIAQKVVNGVHAASGIIGDVANTVGDVAAKAAPIAAAINPALGGFAASVAAGAKGVGEAANVVHGVSGVAQRFFGGPH